MTTSTSTWSRTGARRSGRLGVAAMALLLAPCVAIPANTTAATAALEPASAVLTNSAADLLPSPVATVDQRVRALVKVIRKPATGQSIRVSLGTRVTPTAMYSTEISIDSAGRVKVQHRSRVDGRWASLSSPRVVMEGIRSGSVIVADSSVTESLGRTRVRTAVASPGRLAVARSIVEWDARAARPKAAGTTVVLVTTSGSAVKPTVTQLGVQQPSGSVGAGLPPNPDRGLRSWPGTVTRVVDGDTFETILDADTTATPVQVRNAGIQAMEHGQCGYWSATDSMSKLLPPGARVLLTARNPSSTSDDGEGRHRPLRFAHVLQGGQWVDVQRALLSQGRVVVFSFNAEPAHATEYREAMEIAASQSRGMFTRSPACGSEAQTWPSIWVNFDGDGDERKDPNTEYVRVLNRSTSTKDLSGWWIRTGSQRAKVLPQGTLLPPGAYLTLHVGYGTDSTSRRVFYWRWSGPQFPNTYNPPEWRQEPGAPGGVAYLFDRKGRLQAHTTYPCATCGSHPLRPAIDLSAEPIGRDERILVKNVSGSRIDLSYQYLQIRGGTFEIRPNTYLNPGETLTVRMLRGQNTRLAQYWGRDGEYWLPDAVGEVRLRDARDVEAACVAWGSGRC